jgi:hypothetical protein
VIFLRGAPGFGVILKRPPTNLFDAIHSEQIFMPKESLFVNILLD